MLATLPVLVTAFLQPPGGVDVQWRAPHGCPDAQRVRDRVEAMLTDAPQTSMRAELDVSTTADGFALAATIHTRDGTTTRRLDGPVCDELAEAAALLVSMAVAESADDSGHTDDAVTAGAGVAIAAPVQVPAQVDPASQPESEPIQSRPDRHEPKEVRPARPPERDTLTRTKPAGGVGLRLTARAGVGAAVLPAATGWLSGRVGLGGKHWQAGVGVEHWLAREASLPAGTSATFQLTAGTLWACGVPTRGRFDFPLCGGFAAGAEVARGVSGLENRQRAHHLWLALNVGARARWWIQPRVAAVLGVDAVVALARPRVEVGGIGRVCCGSGGITAAAGIAVRFDPTAGQRIATRPDNHPQHAATEASPR